MDLRNHDREVLGKKVQVGNDQKLTQSERNSLSINRGVGIGSNVCALSCL